MFLLSFLVVGLALGFLSGGNLNKLGSIPFRFAWLIPLAFVLQVVILSSLFASSPLSTYVPGLYVLTILLLVLAVLLNLHLKSLWILGLGLLLNLSVIAVNGGLMPTALDQLALAGHPKEAEQIRLDGHLMNAQPLTAETRLPFLGDIYALPAPIPLSNVFSVGDMLIGIGALVLIYGGMGGKGARVLTPRRQDAGL